MSSKRKSAKPAKSNKPANRPSAARISGQFEGNISAAGELHIAPGARCKANIRAGNIRVDGRFEGNLAARRSMFFGNNANCKGSFNTPSLHVDGTVEGQVFVQDRMDMSSSAQMQGEIFASRLTVADGASFAGRCTIGKFANKAPARKAA